MLQVKVTRSVSQRGQTVSVLAGNGATTASTVTTQPDGLVEISVTSQTAGTSVVTAGISNGSQSRNDIYRRCQDGEDHSIWRVGKDGSEADGSTANTRCGRG
ncbi:Ig-like domain-containing protein [Escherichia coli]|nr:Ig-like domain-containing protein [Escherichia coli]